MTLREYIDYLEDCISDTPEIENFTILKHCNGDLLEINNLRSPQTLAAHIVKGIVTDFHFEGESRDEGLIPECELCENYDYCSFAHDSENCTIYNSESGEIVNINDCNAIILHY